MRTNDIDLVIRLNSMTNMNKVTVFCTIANTTKHAGIAKPKVPIIKFVTTHGHIPVDIGTN